MLLTRPSLLLRAHHVLVQRGQSRLLCMRSIRHRCCAFSTVADASATTIPTAASASSTSTTPTSSPTQPPSPTPSIPRPHVPRARTIVKSKLPSGDLIATPAPPTITSQQELDDLIKKGYDGTVYDILTCYQLGTIFFDGIQPSKNNTNSTTTATSSTNTNTNAASSSSTSSDGGAELTPSAAGPWSLPKNYTQSLLWYTNAAFEGHVPSRTRLGVMYLAGYGIKRNIPTAFQLFTESSELGDRDAQAHLGAMYLQGVGAPSKDVAKAIEWYSKAADRGHVRAQAILAKLLDSPEAGPNRDAHLASHWLNESARLGHVDSQFSLAQRHDAAQDPYAAFEWYLKAAKNGHAQAQYLVGMAYLENSHAIAAQQLTHDERMPIAARYFALASDQGNVHAQARLGFAHFHGIGIRQDRGLGIMWLNNAAEANLVDAQLMLGSIAYDEYQSSSSSPSSSTVTPLNSTSAGQQDEDKKLQTAKHYFSKVLENANKNCTTLPSGSLPLLVRMTQDPSLASQLIRQYHEQTGQPWLGDLKVFLTEMIWQMKLQEATNKQ